jgi:hypothetical protein
MQSCRIVEIHYVLQLRPVHNAAWCLQATFLTMWTVLTPSMNSSFHSCTAQLGVRVLLSGSKSNTALQARDKGQSKARLHLANQGPSMVFHIVVNSENLTYHFACVCFANARWLATKLRKVTNVKCQPPRFCFLDG